MIKNLLKSVIGVAITPVAVISDILTLPSSAYSGKSPFKNTENLIDSVKKNVNKVIESK